MKIVKRVLSVAVVASSVTALAGGCGGDSSGNAADTGLPPTQLLSETTPAEATQACERVQSSFQSRFNTNSLIEAVCTMGAAANTTSASSCGNLRETCIEEAMQPDSELMMALDLDAIDFSCDTADLSQCEGATVADLETCLDDTFDLLYAALHRFDCSDAGTVTDADLESFSFEPAESCGVVTCGDAEGPFG